MAHWHWGPIPRITLAQTSCGDALAMARTGRFAWPTGLLPGAVLVLAGWAGLAAGCAGSVPVRSRRTRSAPLVGLADAVPSGWPFLARLLPRLAVEPRPARRATHRGPQAVSYRLQCGVSARCSRAVLRRRGLLVPLQWCWRRVLTWTLVAGMAVGWAGLATSFSSDWASCCWSVAQHWLGSWRRPTPRRSATAME